MKDTQVTFMSVVDNRGAKRDPPSCNVAAQDNSVVIVFFWWFYVNCKGYWHLVWTYCYRKAIFCVQKWLVSVGRFKDYTCFEIVRGVNVTYNIVQWCCIKIISLRHCPRVVCLLLKWFSTGFNGCFGFSLLNFVTWCGVGCGYPEWKKKCYQDKIL